MEGGGNAEVSGDWRTVGDEEDEERRSVVSQDPVVSLRFAKVNGNHVLSTVICSRKVKTESWMSVNLMDIDSPFAAVSNTPRKVARSVMGVCPIRAITSKSRILACWNMYPGSLTMTPCSLIVMNVIERTSL